MRGCDGRSVRGAAQLRAAGIGAIHMDPMHVQLGGVEPLEEASWRRASGEVTLSGEVDLAKLVDLLPPNTLPLAGASGKLTVAGHVTRKAASDAIPDVTLSLKTSGLRFETRGAPDVSKGRTVLVAAPKSVESGDDVAVDIEANGAARSGKIVVSLLDTHGTVVSIVAASTAVPYAELAWSGTAFAERMLRVPFTARVAMPSRSLDVYPT